ncbi:hypothetical protein PS619_04299 [Pseudomonas fluorescens]|nr:hypothetical protein PS619_04299 [Pseudomonas fluorescens]
MYFSGLKKSLQELEEKKFYDIALLFLSFEGYKELSIVDGTGDGGRDVVCSRPDLRIQLSVRKDWENKINTEAATTLAKKSNHFLYITNRYISEKRKAEFLASEYKFGGSVEVTIIDLNRLATALAQPGRMKQTYESLGQIINDKIPTTSKEIALSNILLLSSEAKDLRDNVIESNIKASIYKNPNITEQQLIETVGLIIPGIKGDRSIATALSRLRTRGEIISAQPGLQLSPAQSEAFAAAELDFTLSIEKDIDSIHKTYSVPKDQAEKIIRLSLEIDARNGSISGDGIQAVELLEFIGSLGLNRKKAQLFEDLSRLTVARVSQYGSAIDHIFSTNTFDIYRSLGGNSNIVMLLDSSVAMPMLFGLSFTSARSRYGIAAAALNDLCKEHNINVAVPRVYLNEMAHHGLKALEYIENYNALGEDSKEVLKASGNAYLSHYSHIRDHISPGKNLSLQEFLSYFGIKKGRQSFKIENAIETLLDQLGISIIETGPWDRKIRDELAFEKPGEAAIIIDHDASVSTFLKNDSNSGYIFSTWDRKIIDYVEGLARVFAQTPSRVVDFLTMAGGADYDSEQSISLLTTLMYCDEAKASALARKIEDLNSAENIYEINRFTEELRTKDGRESDSAEDIVSDFFERTS